MRIRFQSVLAGLGFLLGATTVHAQEPPCGVSTVKEAAPLLYPPIALAAHVTGVVIVRTTFSLDGSVESAEVWRGPVMLQNASLTFIKGLHANAYGGSRTCLLSASFRMQENVPNNFHGDQLTFVVQREQSDPLHYTIAVRTAPLVTMSDPAGKIVRKRFLGIF